MDDTYCKNNSERFNGNVVFNQEILQNLKDIVCGEIVSYVKINDL
jgi:hypothetical protein